MPDPDAPVLSGQHSPSGAPTHVELHFAGSANWLEEAVFGSLDGVITALALVVAVTVVLGEPDRTVFLTVIAAAVAGTLSMFVGAYLSARSRANLVRRERAREEWEVDHVPDIERREIEEIFQRRGFNEEEVAMIVRRITSDKKLWVDTMMRDELGLDPAAAPEPLRHAGIIGLSYLAGGAIPALPFLWNSAAGTEFLGHLLPWDFLGALTVGGVILATIGFAEAGFSGANRARSAIEVLALGLATAITVFLVTTLLTPVISAA